MGIYQDFFQFHQNKETVLQIHILQNIKHRATSNIPNVQFHTGFWQGKKSDTFRGTDKRYYLEREWCPRHEATTRQTKTWTWKVLLMSTDEGSAVGF